MDKSFGILFGLFKGYLVAVCFFSLLNWFYSYEKWGISTTSAFSFNIVKKGSDVKNKISEIQERVARKIQGAADGIQQLGKTPLPQLGKTPLPRLPRRYAKRAGGNKSKKYRIYKRKSRKL